MRWIAALALCATPLADAIGWDAQPVTDKMTGAETGTSLRVQSMGTMSLGFPYEGPQRVTLALTHQRGRVSNAVLAVPKGQFRCPAARCTFRVRFDDGAVEEWPMTFLPEFSSVIGFESPSRFAARLQRAKALRIEASFFRDGLKVLNFAVAGLPEAFPQ